MERFSHFDFQRSSGGVVSRTIRLVFVAAIVFGIPIDDALGDRLADDPAAPKLKIKQLNLRHEPSSDSRMYAQNFWSIDRFFGRSAPNSAPRQNPNTSRSGDERADALSNELKQQVIQQLRGALPAPPTRGPLLLIVSIPKQTVTLYDAGVAVAESPVSSGTTSNPTPTGIFSVLEKHWWHRSNIYSAAPMPYMQRINWEGVALHAGELPGYPASHGCIRLPYEFALRLWGTTKIGTRVIVTNDDVEPVEIAHKQLFAFSSMNGQASESKYDYRTAPAIKPSLPSAPISMNVPVAPSLSVNEILGGSTPNPTASEPKILAGQSDKRFGPGTAANTDANAKPVDKSSTADAIDAEATDGIEYDATMNTVQYHELIVSNDTALNGSNEVSIVHPSLPTETFLTRAENLPIKADQPPHSWAQSIKIANLDAPIGSMPNTATSQSRSFNSPFPPPVAPTPLQERLLRPGPLSILISSRDQRMYVRKGLEPLFDVPIRIANYGRPIGTHLFTAVAPGGDGVTMRWMVVSLPSTLPAMSPRMAGKPLAAASDALDRLDLPKGASDFISGLPSIGTTLIITDQGLGRSASALDTDFMVLTRN